MRRLRRWLGRLAVLTALVVGIAAIALWLLMRASLPLLAGARTLTGLSDVAVIDRDAAGVPTLTAQTRTDLARALGFVHAQDRYFEMDLLRRAAAGELSALLGPSQLRVDRQLRVHEFRNVARSVVAALGPQERSVLEAYAAGVNAGLAALRSRPFEYWLLGSSPKAWSAEDSILCVHSMYLQLQDSQGHTQLQRGLLRTVLPEPAWRFLEAGAPEWDAPVDDSSIPEPRVPSAAEFDLRGASPSVPAHAALRSMPTVHAGSNNWAVAGAHTATGAGLVANDMHLSLRVPNIWYRARMVVSGDDPIDLSGITLPGTPLMVAGSNGSLAWGFTNSYGEFTRVVRLVPVDGGKAYQTASGPQPLGHAEEIIEVRGAPAERLDIALTQWGPVIGNDWEGRSYALQWTAQDAAAVNLNMIQLEYARTVPVALQAAATFGIPGQNFMAADVAGHIGWTIGGRLPIRRGPNVPQESTDPSVGFGGWLEPGSQPRIEDPPSGLLWSANARVIGGTAASVIGDDGMDRGARASQIRDDLRGEARPVTPALSLAIQLDDRALFLERWRSLLSDLLERRQASSGAAHSDVRATLRLWSGHASPSDPAYRLVRVFRDEVAARVYAMLTAPARRRAPDFEFDVPSSFEGPLWRLLQQRPAHLLNADYADWDALLLAALQTSERLPDSCRSLDVCTWGTVNSVHIAHPLSGAIKGLGFLLDLPTKTLAGGLTDMPRIQGPHFGASERFSVSPGHESQGYFEMPGGQSGHPLSPFYREGFDDWAEGKAAPFLPGESRYRLRLTP